VALTLAQLLAAESQSQIKARLLATLNKPGFPITDWENGAVMRTDVEMIALVYRDLVGNLLPQLAAGGFLDEAEGDWLTLHAEQIYDLERTAATHTIQQVRLTVEAGNGPYTIAAGDLIVRSRSGRRYSNSTGGTLDEGVDDGTLDLEFQSESPQDSSTVETNYIDPANTITELITPLPGVTCNNPARDFSDVTQVGNSTGTVTPTRTVGGSAVEAVSVKVTITKSGQVTAGQATYELDGDGNQVSLGGVIPATFDIPDTNIRLTFANGAVNPSFFIGDTFTFASPGSPVLEQGRDAESDNELRGRCRARWPALSDNETEDKYILWAKAASIQVTKVTVRPSDVIAGRVNVTIAGQVNPLGGGVVAAVQAYINDRVSVTDFGLVQAAGGVDVSVVGQVTVPLGKGQEVKDALDALWCEIEAYRTPQVE